MVRGEDQTQIASIIVICLCYSIGNALALVFSSLMITDFSFIFLNRREYN